MIIQRALIRVAPLVQYPLALMTLIILFSWFHRYLSSSLDGSNVGEFKSIKRNVCLTV